MTPSWKISAMNRSSNLNGKESSSCLQTATIVIDPDEDIFVLYSELQSQTNSEAAVSTERDGFRGLGYINSHKDVLEINFEIVLSSNISLPPTTAATTTAMASAPTSTAVSRKDKSYGHKARKAAKHSSETAMKKDKGKTIEINIELLQDTTALRSRKGDTGSVLWKASRDFAQLILQQYHAPSEQSLLDRDQLHSRPIHVLELGTLKYHLLPLLLPGGGHYTATDIKALVPLILKNVTHNSPRSNITVSELDWLSIDSSSPSQKQKIYDPSNCPVDLLLAVDCIYHPSLITPFLSTLDWLTTKDRTVAMVVSELRAADVMSEFLEKWVGMEGWEVWRIPSGLPRIYVVYVGWKI